jgi:hypothetical protein
MSEQNISATEERFTIKFIERIKSWNTERLIELLQEKKKDLQLDEDFAILHKDLWLRFPQYVHSMGLALGLVSGLADKIKEVG